MGMVSEKCGFRHSRPLSPLLEQNSNLPSIDKKRVSLVLAPNKNKSTNPDSRPVNHTDLNRISQPMLAEETKAPNQNHSKTKINAWN